MFSLCDAAQSFSPCSRIHIDTTFDLSGSLSLPSCGYRLSLSARRRLHCGQGDRSLRWHPPSSRWTRVESLAVLDRSAPLLYPRISISSLPGCGAIRYFASIALARAGLGGRAEARGLLRRPLLRLVRRYPSVRAGLFDARGLVPSSASSIDNLVSPTAFPLHGCSCRSTSTSSTRLLVGAFDTRSIVPLFRPHHRPPTRADASRSVDRSPPFPPACISTSPSTVGDFSVSR